MSGINITDSEDIIAETNSANQVSLKFADKVYDTTDYSGLGRVYLRKNIATVEDPSTGIQLLQTFFNNQWFPKRILSTYCNMIIT